MERDQSITTLTNLERTSRHTALMRSIRLHMAEFSDPLPQREQSAEEASPTVGDNEARVIRLPLRRFVEVGDFDGPRAA